MKIYAYKKYKVALLNMIPPFSNEEICSNLLNFLNECEVKGIMVSKIVLEASKIPYALFFTLEETELDEPYIVIEEIELE